MKLFTKSALLAVLATASLQALAERPNFNYLEGGYLRHRIDNGCVQDGLKLPAARKFPTAFLLPVATAMSATTTKRRKTLRL